MSSKPVVGSLFSGIGGFDLGLERAGFEVGWQCEIDGFCSRVLAKHWPGVRNYGDVRDIGLGRGADNERCKPDDSQERPAALEWDGARVDLICGGFPCQDLSVAGKRAGLDGEQSGLWFEFHRILSELRPKFCLIENVPGLLSSNSGRDFGVVLAGLGELWPAVGWAVLDSQHFGVPQRRRRVYIVGGPSRERVAQVLSLCEGGDWHTQAGREKGQDVASPLGASATSFGGQRFDLDHETYIPQAFTEVTAEGWKPSVGTWLASHEAKEPHTLIAHSLRADGFDASEDGTGSGTPLVFQQNQRNEVRILPVAGALPAEPGMKQQNYIAVRTAQTSSNGWGMSEDGMPYTLDGAQGQGVAMPYGVRRLTPVECCRLQGFPDDWFDGLGTADGPVYKALGNAVTVPVIEYLGLRIMEVL